MTGHDVATEAWTVCERAADRVRLARTFGDERAIHAATFAPDGPLAPVRAALATLSGDERKEAGTHYALALDFLRHAFTSVPESYSASDRSTWDAWYQSKGTPCS